MAGLTTSFQGTTGPTDHFYCRSGLRFSVDAVGQGSGTLEGSEGPHPRTYISNRDPKPREVQVTPVP